MSEEERHTIKLQPQLCWEGNNLHLKPEQMKRWLYKSPMAIKTQLTENGNMFATFLSYTYSAHQRNCTVKSEINPANYAAKMVSNLLKDYVDPTKKSKIQQAQIDKSFIQNVIECSEQSNLLKSTITDNAVVTELIQSITDIKNMWKKQEEHEKNLEYSISVALDLRLINQEKLKLPSLDATEAQRTREKIAAKEKRCYDQLQELHITPQEAFAALKQKENDEYNKAREYDQKGQEKRTAAVQRGTIITTYDPNDKDISGHYCNVRHYRTNEDGSLTPVSKNVAAQILNGANHESSINNSQKFDVSFLHHAKIDYRGH